MTNKLTLLASVVAASTAFMATSASAADSTLDKVTKQGYLTCGVSTGLPGVSNPNSKGEWEGIDVEYCQALAAAVLGDKTKDNKKEELKADKTERAKAKTIVSKDKAGEKKPKTDIFPFMSLVEKVSPK